MSYYIKTSPAELNEEYLENTKSGLLVTFEEFLSLKGLKPFEIKKIINNKKSSKNIVTLR